MNVRFYTDLETGLPHIHNHGVHEDEVEEVLARPGDDFRGSRSSRIALGRTWAGRYLKIVYVPDPQPGSVFVVTAYEMKGKLLAAYRRRQRRK